MYTVQVNMLASNLYSIFWVFFLYLSNSFFSFCNFAVQRQAWWALGSSFGVPGVGINAGLNYGNRLNLALKLTLSKILKNQFHAKLNKCSKYGFLG